MRFMRFLEKMARPANAALEAMAVVNPIQVKESSVAEARATPARVDRGRMGLAKGREGGCWGQAGRGRDGPGGEAPTEHDGEEGKVHRDRVEGARGEVGADGGEDGLEGCWGSGGRRERDARAVGAQGELRAHVSRALFTVWVKETATAANDTLVRQWPKACRKEGRVTSLMNSLSGCWYGTSFVAQKTAIMPRPITRWMTDTNLGRRGVRGVGWREYRERDALGERSTHQGNGKKL